MDGGKLEPKNASVIYVVDDDTDVRAGLSTLFESVELSVITFGSTIDFMKYQRSEKTSCLVLDVRLSGTSGLDLQAELAKAGVNIPIIFMTGYGDIPMS